MSAEDNAKGWAEAISASYDAWFFCTEGGRGADDGDAWASSAVGANA